mgnify:CR=1 FL=1
MKRLLLTSFLLFIVFPLIAQCPTSSITLSSQADVDAFIIDYPNCTGLQADLYISGSDITDLSPLQNLESLENINISNNDNLITLNGLQNIQTITDFNFIINNNPMLENLDGLSGLFNVDVEFFDISFNASLVDLDGLANASITTRDFSIMGNNVLENFDGLIGTSEIIDASMFTIVNNPALVSITGLANAEITGAFDFLIANNNTLSSLDGLEGVFGFIDIISINNNDALESISALSGVDTVGMVIVMNNPTLTTLNGLEGLETGYNDFLSIEIIDNSSLIDISALNGIDRFTLTNLSVNNNSALSECSSYLLCSILQDESSSTSFDIYDNAPGCNSTIEIEENCVACPSGDLILNSQAEVDAVGVDYPECSIISGLVIDGDDITDLSPLSNISNVLGNIIIKNNNMLQTLEGLNNLSSFTGSELSIVNNPLITSISALNNLVNLNENSELVVKVENNAMLASLQGLGSIDFTNVIEAYIVNNDALVNLVGLENVTFLFTLVISDNDGLTSLIGLDNYNEGMDILIDNNASLIHLDLPNFISIQYLTISNNPLLQNLDGLSSLQNVYVGISLENNVLLTNIDSLNNIDLSNDTGEIIITDNSSLSSCSIDYICSYLEGEGVLTVANNNEDCNTLDEINIFCAPCEYPVVLNSQADVNNFPILYAECPNSLLNGLLIQGEDIVDLAPLSIITNVENGLIVAGNPLLESLEGLEGLTSVDVFEINENEQLTSLATFSSQLTVNSLNVLGNSSLTSLSGFENVMHIEHLVLFSATGLVSLDGFPTSQTSIGNIDIFETTNLNDITALSNISTAESVNIGLNQSLDNLEGLEGLTTIQSNLAISANQVLMSLQGLHNLSSEISEISITFNPVLTDISAIGGVMTSSLTSLQIEDNLLLEVCSNLAICNYLNDGGNAVIANNSEGCNSIAEIQEACEAYFNIISGTVAFDFNNDGCDVSDYDASNILVTTTGEGETYTSITDESGYYELFVPEGVYVSSVVQSSLPVGFTGAPDTIETVFEGLTESTEVSFCLIAENDTTDVSISLLPLQDPRPGLEAQYIIQFENLGAQTVSGNISFEFDNEIMFYLNSSLSTSAINETSIEWTYDNLAPFESRSFLVNFELFIPPTVQGGEELNSLVQITPLDSDIDTRNNTQGIKEVVVNSYDPNDKTVIQGSEIFEEQVGDYLDYLVRFQNTGTADALEVVVTDTLSNNLDWSTFRILDASHDYRVEITNENEIAFIFEDINLPPEEVDAPGSNGHIAFEIKTKDDLVLGDTVENTANIYFDFNEPIITNTVVTTVVEPLALEDFNPIEVIIYPNPVQTLFTVELPTYVEVYNIRVLSIQGQELMKSKATDVDISNLSRGIYFLNIKTSQGIYTKKIVKN